MGGGGGGRREEGKALRQLDDHRVRYAALEARVAELEVRVAEHIQSAPVVYIPVAVPVPMTPGLQHRGAVPMTPGLQPGAAPMTPGLQHGAAPMTPGLPPRSPPVVFVPASPPVEFEPEPQPDPETLIETAVDTPETVVAEFVGPPPVLPLLSPRALSEENDEREES